MRLYLWSIFLVILFVEIYSVIPSRKVDLQPGESHGVPYLSGAIHLPYSGENAAKFPELIENARNAGLDFLIFADLDSAKSRNEIAKAYGKLDVFVELETATPSGHLLMFYSHTGARDWDEKRLADYAWKRFSGPGKDDFPEAFLVTAHPTHPKVPWNALDRFPDGTEIVNLDSLWASAIDTNLSGTLPTLLAFPFNNFLGLSRFADVPRKDLASWDAMNAASRGRFAVGAVNAHEGFSISSRWPLTWRNAAQSLRTVHNIVFYKADLNEDFDKRQRQIYQYLKKGSSAILFPFVYPFSNNDWHVSCDDQVSRSGDRVRYSPKCNFQVQIPKNFPYQKIVRLWKDGELVREIIPAPSQLEIPVPSAGSYRLEIWARNHSLFRLSLDREVPYLFYNPIYID